MIAYLQRAHPLRRRDLRVVDRRLDYLSAPLVSRACGPSYVSPWEDTQAALNVVLRFAAIARSRYGLSNTDLIGVRAPNADFRGTDLRRTSLASARLSGARFDRARLSTADFRHACLSFVGANLQFADFTRADVTGADFTGATEVNAAVGLSP
jgi:uncharacterized protein YjbI with pentapeptide repeats